MLKLIFYFYSCVRVLGNGFIFIYRNFLEFETFYFFEHQRPLGMCFIGAAYFNNIWIVRTFEQCFISNNFKT